MTPSLFHGPEARDQAVRLADELGLQVSAPIGDQGLKVDDSRALIELALSSGVGDRPPSVVVGPLDAATPEASDALLKTLEDLAEGPLKVVLWADYLEGVSDTIRSRTLATWCPPTPLTPNLLAHLKEPARALASALIQGDAIKILGVFEDLPDSKAGTPWLDLLRATCPALEAELCNPATQEQVLKSWERIRRVLDGKGSTVTAVDALLQEEI